MTPARWARLKELFGKTLELPEHQRPDFLDENCRGDPALRAEVERFLEAERGDFASPLPRIFELPGVPELSRGEMLGHYRVETRAGRGGMGVVYRAYDTRLDRRVALKILRRDLADEPERKQRLFEEARAASGLMHPNIVTVHDIGSDRGIDFIAMEYIEGRSLDELIPAEGMPARQAVHYAIQIAGALAGAHAAGVIHRDLKPTNIRITRDGLLKLLDFGLARRIGVAATDEIEGTPSYMSPEQVRGEELDGRSDIFSFGSVLYRMVTGRDPFDRGSAAGTMNAILESDPPPIAESGQMVPAGLESVILHCLGKAKEDRFQSARDVEYALEAINAGPVPTPAPARGAKWGLPVIVLSVLVIAIAAASAWLASRPLVPSSDGRVFGQVTDEAGAALFPSLAPDGKSVVYASKGTGNWDIYLRRVGSAESVNLTRNSMDDDTQPAFSPDGRQIAFRSERDSGGIFTMNRDGGGVRRHAGFGYNPAWSPDGREMVFAEESITRPEDRRGRWSHLWAVDVSSGRKRQVTKSDSVQPQWSPNGRHIAYWAIDLDGDRDIWTVPAEGGQPTRITKDSYIDWNPVWSPDARYLYFCSNRGGAMGIWRVPMKPDSAEAQGAPEPVRTPGPYPAYLSFSGDGQRMAYVHEVTTGGVWTVRFDPVREVAVSEPKELIRSVRGASRPALSSAGDRLAFNSTEGDEDLFVMNGDGSGFNQLTYGGRNRGPRWAPDGRRLAFFSERSGDWEIWTIDVNSRELRQLTYLAGRNVAWPVWSTDGTRIAYTLFGESTFLMDPRKRWEAQSPEQLPPFPGAKDLFNGWSWSPDGRTLAGFLNQDGGIAIYTVESKSYRKLTDFGADPVWLADSRRLLFCQKGRLEMVDSASGSVHEVLSIAPSEISRRGFSLSPDGNQIYFAVSTTEANVWISQSER